MCGIAGYIGQSKRPKLTYELITELFYFLSSRGTDASGVWGTEVGEGGRVVYHKEPTRSDQFVNKPFWTEQVRRMKLNLLLVHARAASRLRGTFLSDPAVNTNNHPFVSTDKRVGMVHNGTLEEIHFLKNRYRTVSETDSEVLLRMYEHGLDREPLEIEDTDMDVAVRMNGIKDIWSVISSGAMSVAIGERVDEYARLLFLFRNHKRPLWIADLRDTLGQIFFFSSPDIWYHAMLNSSDLRKQELKLIEIPPNQVWALAVDQDQPMMLKPEQISRFDIETKSTGKVWEVGEVCDIQQPKVELNVISGENPVSAPSCIVPMLPKPTQRPQQQSDDLTIDDTKLDEDFGMSSFEPPHGDIKHDEICDQITDLAASIKDLMNIAMIERTVSVVDYQSILESLEQTRVDLEGTLRMAGGR